jgi:hypothetical protein
MQKPGSQDAIEHMAVVGLRWRHRAIRRFFPATLQPGRARAQTRQGLTDASPRPEATGLREVVDVSQGALHGCETSAGLISVEVGTKTIQNWHHGRQRDERLGAALSSSASAIRLFRWPTPWSARR